MRVAASRGLGRPVGGVGTGARTPRRTAGRGQRARDQDMAAKKITRRQFAMVPAAVVLASPVFAQTPAALITRAIPNTGERLPAVGLGTASIFDTDDEATRQKAAAVLQALIGN